jgi:hypothetical protein
MRKLSILAFDDFVMSTTTVYTTMALNETLGAFDKLTIQAVCDSATGTTPTITVAIQHSGDQRTWIAKNGTAEINAFAVTVATPSTIGGDTSATGSMGFVRLAITLGGTTPTMHVKLWVTARDTVA